MPRVSKLQDKAKEKRERLRTESKAARSYQEYHPKVEKISQGNINRNKRTHRVIQPES